MIIAQSTISNVEQQYMLVTFIISIIAIASLVGVYFITRKRYFSFVKYNSNEIYTKQIKTLLSNKPYITVISIFICSFLALQLTATVLKFYTIYCLEKSEQETNYVFLAVLLTGLCALPFWTKIGRKYGKNTIYYIAAHFG